MGVRGRIAALEKRSGQRFGAAAVATLRADLERLAYDPGAGSPRYVILLPPDERQVLLDRVRLLAETDPALAGQPEISLPYVTHCWRCHRP